MKSVTMTENAGKFFSSLVHALLAACAVRKGALFLAHFLYFLSHLSLKDLMRESGRGGELD